MNPRYCSDVDIFELKLVVLQSNNNDALKVAECLARGTFE